MKEESNLKTVWRNFHFAAKAYDFHATFQHTAAEEILKRIDFFQLQPKWILDLGSGTGTMAKFLSERFKRARVVRLDIASAMMREEKRSHLIRRLKKLDFSVQADAHHIPFAKNSFDLVVSNQMLHWSSSIPRVLDEVSRVLGDRGMFFFSTLGHGTLQELEQSLLLLGAERRTHAFLDMQVLGTALLEAGFQEPVLDIDREVYFFEHAKALLQSLKKMGGRNVGSTRRKFQRTLSTLPKIYDSNFRERNRVPATFEIIYGQAFSKRETPLFQEKEWQDISIKR